MADDLIFPMGFDLEEAVKKAEKDWDRTYASRLEKAIQKRALAVKLKIDTTSIKGLDDAIRRLEKINIGGGGTRRAGAELVGFKKQLADLTKEWNKLTAAERGGAAGAALRERYRALQKEAQGYVSTLRAAVTQEDKLAATRDKAARAAERGTAATRNANREYHNQDGYISRLIKRLAVYAGFQQITGFLRNVREVTAQFELQRVSLGAIIQDQTRANALFSEIKQFALKSPISIMDLTKYTKQVAAYRIETDKLFDTTKRLADVSVGLGVDMGRLVLAYGQVKAASYLRAAEIRQFTEAGIPMLELLAKKFKELNGEAVTTEQVMEMVSKRMVGFEMVEDIFNDMTSAGGMFYNMQEKQGNSLFGLWAKLGDAASIMYSEIGNTEVVNNGMKSAIEALTDLMRNWKSVAFTIAASGGLGAVLYGGKKMKDLGGELKDLANKKATEAIRAREIAQRKLNDATKSGTSEDIKAAQATLAKAQADEKAAVSAQKNVNSQRSLLLGFKSMAASFLTGLGIGAIITFVTNLIYDFKKAYEEAHRLKNTLNDIYTENAIQQAQSVRNFERLANIITKVESTERERKNALEELHRTYRDIIPVEKMSVENLRAMAENAGVATERYKELTDAIKQNIAEQNRQKALSAIQEELQPKINKALAGMREAMRSQGASETEMVNFTVRMAEIFSDPANLSRSLTDNVIEALEYAGIEGGERLADRIIKGNGWQRFVRGVNKLHWSSWFGLDPEYYTAIGNLPFGVVNWTTDTELHANNFADAMNLMNATTEAANSHFREQVGVLGEYQAAWEQTQRVISDSVRTAENNESRFMVGQENTNIRINAYKDFLQQVLGDSWNDAFAETSETVAEDGTVLSRIFFDNIMANTDVFTSQQIDAIKQVRSAYNEIVPSDRTVQAMRGKLQELVPIVGGNMDEMQRYLMNGDETWANYSKRIREAKEKYKQFLVQLQRVPGLMDIGEKEAVEKRIAILDAIDPFLAPDSSTNHVSDNRLQTLNDIERKLTEINAKYEELNTKEGNTKAAQHVREIYQSTLDDINRLGQRFNLSFDMPLTFQGLQEDRDKILQVIQQLNATGHERAALELQAKINTATLDKQRKEIENRIKSLADEVSRTKTAREFYDRVLGMTGDIDLASKVSMSIYGSNGAELKRKLADQIKEMVQGTSASLPETIFRADSSIDNRALREWAEENKSLLGDTYKEIIKIADEDDKNLAKTYEGYLKDLEKAKSYSDKRIELARYTANKIAEINASSLPQEEKERLTAGYAEREDKEAAKLEYEAFKDSAMYVHIFENLDHASTTTLKNMRDRLIALKGQWKDLDPTQVKELTKAIADLDGQIAGRNPFKSIAEGFKGLAAARPQKVIDAEMIAATDELAKREEALAAATRKLTEAQTAQVNAQAEVAQARQDLEDALAVSGGEETPEVKAAREVLRLKIETYNVIKETSAASVSSAKTEVDEAADKYEEQKKIIDKLVEEGKLREANVKKIELANAKIDEYQSQINEALDGVRKMMEAFGASEEDMQFFDDVVGGLNEIVDAGQQAAVSVAFMSRNILGGITSGVSAIGGLVSGFTNLFSAGKVKKANKEIKRQQELLDQLEYSYNRLQTASDKLFGEDYINNFNQQQKNLQAQAEAYRKQAEAERSKGKKADKEKIKEYENAYRDTMDEIANMEAELMAKFEGSSRADTARDFAQSWLEAKASFASTTDAIKSKYKDMIQSMIVEGAAAKIIDSILAPMWDNMNALLEKGDTVGAIDYLVNGMDEFITSADNGMNVLWKSLEAKGYDMQKLLGDTSGSEYTGIKRDIAGASEESINGLAAHMNTVEYYVSEVPGMAANIAAMRALMEGGSTMSIPTATAGWTDWQQQAMDAYTAIQRNTADTVVECRNIVAQCKSIADDIHRTMDYKNGRAGMRVYI